MKTTFVKITKSHLAEAAQKDSHHCMIADAIKTKFPKSKYIQVDLQSVRFTDRGRRFVYFTPPHAQAALLKFDQGLPVEPFEMVLAAGVETKSGWQANHPGKSRKGRKYKKTRKTRIFPQREREFGLRCLTK